jgi:hypothetical protein
MSSFGREVKQFVLCRRFVARKRTLLDYVSRSKFPPSLTEGHSSKCPYTRVAWAPTGDERRQPKKSDAVHKGPV